MELTREQECFSDFEEEVFLEACPGAGKTRSIIARLKRIGRNLPPRRGVAILSFTNSAVDEFRERCRRAGADKYQRHPNFIGTLDSFVRRFIVLPTWPSDQAEHPVVLNSWSDLDVEIRLVGADAFRGGGVSLDRFDPLTGEIDPEAIGHTGLQSHVRQHKSTYERLAQSRRSALIRSGYMSSEDARRWANSAIQDETVGVALGRALASRFQEVVVDEGQDCNPLDLALLEWLRGLGIRMTFVCDPNQAIYEFRSGDLASIRRFQDSYPLDSRMLLTGNFRSSQAICGLAATLRSDGRLDQPRGDSSNAPYPVVILAYQGVQLNSIIGQSFIEEMNQVDIPIHCGMLLAHSRTAASQAATGLAAGDEGGNSRIASLARSVAGYWGERATPRSREAILQSIERLLLDFTGKRQVGEHTSRVVARHRMNRRLLRRQALALLLGLPRQCGESDEDAQAWVDIAKESLARLSLEPSEGVSIGAFLRRPPKNVWTRLLHGQDVPYIHHGTIHESKGHEFDAVCVVLPPDRAPGNRTSTLLGEWERRTDSEAKRVVYVGVTRARYLGSLAVPVAHVDKIVAILETAAVPTRLREI